MSKQASASQTRTATAQGPAPKTAAAEHSAEPTAAEAPAGRPKVALVPDAPAAEPKKRRGRPPAAKREAAPRKAKAARKDILFLVETEEESGRFETQKVPSVAELLDLMDENRRVLASRQWREF